jgi:DNA polymerase III epsilon subunit-like protein
MHFKLSWHATMLCRCDLAHSWNCPFPQGLPPLEKISTGIVDTLKLAKKMRPRSKNSPDALCAEFGIDSSSRQLHGALLDAELLAEVYLAMTNSQTDD